MPGDAIPPERDDVRKAFGIEVDHARRHPYGFESECWVLDDRWFVKVWRKDPPANLELLEHLDLPVPVPLRTRDGRLTARTGGRSFAVFLPRAKRLVAACGAPWPEDYAQASVAHFEKAVGTTIKL